MAVLKFGIVWYRVDNKSINNHEYKIYMNIQIKFKPYYMTRGVGTGGGECICRRYQPRSGCAVNAGWPRLELPVLGHLCMFKNQVPHSVACCSTKWISWLTLSKTTNFRLFQTERVCRQQFQIWWKWHKVFSKRCKNTVGKGEIALYQQFLLLQSFQKDLYRRYVKTRACLGKA